jgi:hypothetical protein
MSTRLFKRCALWLVPLEPVSGITKVALSQDLCTPHRSDGAENSVLRSDVDGLLQHRLLNYKTFLPPAYYLT